MEEKNIGQFLTEIILMAAIFIGFIFVIFDLRGKFLIAQLLFFFLLIVLACPSLVGIYYNFRWGWLLITLVSALIILDEIFIYILHKSFGVVYLVSFAVALMGLIFSLVNVKPRKVHVMKVAEERIESLEKVEKAETPSKKRYVAKKSGKFYHKADCFMAKRLRSENQEWFGSMEEAASQGHKAHRCVK